MQLTTPPEMTTAVTDFILGCLALGLLARIRALKGLDRLKAGAWSWVFGLFCLASLYGSVVHAVAMPAETRDLLWMPLSFILGMMVSVFVIALIVEWKGTAVLKRAAAVMISLGLIFFAVMMALSKVITGYFIVFIGYSGLAMAVSFCICLYLALQRHDGAYALMAAGVAAIIIASVVQAMRTFHVTVIWEFDYNSAYHLILMAAVVLIYTGIRKSAVP
ncbi:MAG: hypothetical protein KA369_06560 [Spirochaetes bacterium]|nr:hypothetical protein [Spirochaetota bacterium]